VPFYWTITAENIPTTEMAKEDVPDDLLWLEVIGDYK